MVDGECHEPADVLYQDSRWIRLARIQYGMFAYPLWILGLVGSVSTGVLSDVVLVLALLTAPIAICERRLRKMGLIITGEALVLVRPISRIRIPWREIESFELVAAGGWIDYGYRRVGVRRRRRIIPRYATRIPTVWVSVKDQRWFSPLRGPSRLEWSGGEIADVLDFLGKQLAHHRDAAREPEDAPRSFLRA